MGLIISVLTNAKRRRAVNNKISVVNDKKQNGYFSIYSTVIYEFFKVFTVINEIFSKFSNFMISCLFCLTMNNHYTYSYIFVLLTALCWFVRLKLIWWRWRASMAPVDSETASLRKATLVHSRLSKKYSQNLFKKY